MIRKLTKAPNERTARAPQDRPLLVLDAEAHAAFLKALEVTAELNAKLKRLMVSKAPWEE